jgi:hypothetical protein
METIKIGKIVEQIKKIKVGRIITVLFFGWYFFSSALNASSWHFIDNVDLIFHEAGHWIFIFFGEFIQIFGGSLNQILIPAVFCIYFLLRRDYFSSSILLMWFGYNIVNVSVYMSDAVAMQLPLLGGDSSIHDWNYLLSHLGLLPYTHNIASVVYGIGLLVIAFAIGIGLKYSMVYEEGDVKGF